LKRKEKLDPTAVPRSGPHWQHDDRGAPGSAAHSRGGKGKKLFDAGDRASNASSGRTEEKWGHDKFLELSSSSGAAPPPFHPPPFQQQHRLISRFLPPLPATDAAPGRSASSKAKGRQNPHSNSAPPASAATVTDALAASERAPRHGRGAQGAVQAVLSTANDSPTANGGHGVDPGDAGCAQLILSCSPKLTPLPPPRLQPRAREQAVPSEGGTTAMSLQAATVLAAAGAQ
jgi:hypothetical protein